MQNSDGIMTSMTIGDLKKLVNQVPDKYNDNKIIFYYGLEEYAVRCDNAWFDLCIDYETYGVGFSITVYETEEAMQAHEGGCPWTDADIYL